MGACLWYCFDVAKIVDSFRPKKGGNGPSDWTLEEHHPWLAPGGACNNLYETLVARIQEDNPDWEMYIAKYYVGFRTGKRNTRLALETRVGGGGKIMLFLTKSVDDLVDVKGICSDRRLSKTSRCWPTSATFANTSQLDDVMAIINQC